MTSKEFVIWLKGFTEGVHEYNISPKQWDLLKEKLEQVDDNTIPIGGVIVDHNTFRVNDPGFYPNHTGTTSKGILTTTPGVTGTITFRTGSNVTYTTNGTPNWYSTAIPEDKTLLND
jgi:hypothetical protein